MSEPEFLIKIAEETSMKNKPIPFVSHNQLTLKYKIKNDLNSNLPPEKRITITG